MIVNQLSLLKVRRFLPLFLTQFLGAFNDNLFKNALVILITYTLSNQLNYNPEVLITVAAGIFILPFFLFSSLAGQLADKFEKSQLIRYTKLAEIMLSLFIIVGFYAHSVSLLMFALFLLGTQATFFGPMKYSILPDALASDELIAGNALLETGTYVAILVGTMIGGVLAMLHAGQTLVSLVVFLMALTGYVTSLWIPRSEAASPQLTLNFNLLTESKKIIANLRKNDTLYLTVLGISWFWLVGATYLSQLPSYVKNILGASSSVVTLFLTFFTLGIGVGSLLCNRLLKSKIQATYVPLAALAMAIFGIDLVLASQHGFSQPDHLITLSEFLAHGADWRILIDLFLLAVCGGVYTVPLYAILQHESEPEHRSRAIASNNIINALFMVVAAAATSVMLLLHFSVTQVFLVVALANVFVAIYICNLLPEELVKSALIWLCKTLYRVEVRGLENYNKAGNRVLIIANHTSFLDAMLLAAFLPDKLTFAIHTEYAKKRWVQLFLKLVNTFPIDPVNPMAAKSLIEYLRTDKRVVIFPEGRITVTGALMKIYEGPGLIADKASAQLLPVRIDGAQYTYFSYLKGKVKLRWFPKITITILEPRSFKLPESLTGRRRRSLISAQLYDIMTDSLFLSSNRFETIFQSVINARSIHGRKHVVVEDIEQQPLNYQRLILASFVLGRKLARKSKRGEYVGFLLPNSVGAVVAFFALQAYRRVPTMLNFTAGLKNIISACRTAKLKSIVTSRRFVNVANLQPIISGLIAEGLTIIYLEDIRKKINFVEKTLGSIVAYFPQTYYRFINSINKNNEQEINLSPAVVLFTSGSEGEPKGVVLSHYNIQSNRFQLLSRIDFGPTDRVFNALPMFHAFGLSSATLLPIISGMRVFMYPSPLHYRIVPELCYSSDATIIFGTDTFLTGYAKYAHPYNFYSVRYIFAGAEKLREETRRQWIMKFGIRLLEGYGATEAAPVLATNTFMQYKAETVGRLLPCIRYELRPVEGISVGARLFVSGPNIMMGYMMSDQPGVIQPLQDGWHDTGDIVSIDRAGYITIQGRTKRFAKIGGEMVSLGAIETAIHHLWPEAQHAVMSVPDPRKGEQIVLLTNRENATQSEILKHFKLTGIPELGLPRKILFLPEVPVLASGKIDYQGVRAFLENVSLPLDDSEDEEQD